MNKNILHQLKTNGQPLDGMCYVLQCDDGSTVVVDGGMDNGDAETLLDYLKKLSGGEKPTVDMWIITHAHPDHTFACKGMGQRHSEEITVKKLVYRFPSLEFKQKRDPGTVRECEVFDQAVANFKGVEIITPSKGDRYTFGTLIIDILFTYADLPSLDEDPFQNTNDTSTVFRVTANGQTILFLGDVEASADRVMIEAYGHELKSDVCQVAHHGTFSSTAEFYSYIDPQILLWPLSADRIEKQMREVPADRFLMGKMHVRDVYLAGHGTVALELPVQPRETPYLPEVPYIPDKPRVARIAIPEAKKTPKIGDFSDPAWEQCPFRLMDGSGSEKPEAAKVEYRALWDQDALYVMIRVHKKAVSDPENISSVKSDSVRIYLTEDAVSDVFCDWASKRNCPGFIENLKIYPEKKHIKGQLASNTDESICSSAYEVKEDSYTVCARVQFVSPHKKGDLIGLNLEANGVAEAGGRRIFSVNLRIADDGNYHFRNPYAIAFAALDSGV